MSAVKPRPTNRASRFRPQDDHYNTPREASIPFLKECDIVFKEVWEPACGEGALSEVLKAFGYIVTSTTLTDRNYGETGIDFLTEGKLRAPVIITNPPFRIIDKFIYHALELQPEILAIFCRTKFLEGGRRHKLIHSK